MKTAVIMKRELFGKEVSQNSKTNMFSGTDLVKAGNAWRSSNGMSSFNLSQWLNTKSTTEFIKEIEMSEGKALVKGRGRNAHTWLHPLLFIDCALSISPKLKVEAYKWLFDELIKTRNMSGDSYKKMCGSLYVRHENNKTFQKYIKTVADKIKLACRVDDWQKATELQLKKRHDLHKAISLLADVMNNNDEAVRIAILKHEDVI